MFFLGQSASYLPYLLLAVTYFAGIAGYSMGLFHKSTSTEELSNTIIEVKEASESHTNNDVYILSSSDSQFNSSEIQDKSILQVKLYNSKINFHLDYLQNLFPVSDKYLSNSFSRPPPVC